MAFTKTLVEPDLSTVLKAVKDDVKATLNAVSIGYIQNFDSSNQTATIQLAFKRIVGEAPDGTKTYKEHPLLIQCPVMTLFGGDAFLSMPIQSGDSCIVLFSDRELDEWLYSAGVNAPQTLRMHDISDAIAIVGIRSFQNSIAAYLANGIRLSFASNSKIDLTEDAIQATCDLFTHTGDVQINGSLSINGNMYGNGSNNVNLHANIVQDPAYTISAGNGATGTFNVVTVVNGIVVSGT